MEAMMLTDKFLLELKQKYFDALAPLIQGHNFEKKQWDFINKAGSIEINVSRGGDIFEKVCVSDISAKVTIPDRDYESSIQWLGIQTFPLNPLVPMFMGIFERVDEKGLVHHPGFFDVYPVTPFKEDKLYLQEEIGAVCKKHGRPYPDLPEGYLKMFRLKEAGIGVGYGAGMALMPDESSAEYFEDAANAILRAYLTLVSKRKDGEYSQQQVDEMHRFRSEWVKFTFTDNRFYQGGVQLGVPAESFMLHMLPPSVKF